MLCVAPKKCAKIITVIAIGHQQEALYEVKKKQCGPNDSSDLRKLEHYA